MIYETSPVMIIGGAPQLDNPWAPRYWVLIQGPVHCSRWQRLLCSRCIVDWIVFLLGFVPLCLCSRENELDPSS